VSSFNARTGAVTPQPGDYSFGQIAGGQNNNALTIGGSLSVAIGGSIAATTVPGSGVLGNISGNAASITGSINGSQVSGNISGNAATATSATNALALGGLAPTSYALLGAASNTFTGNVSAANFTG